MRAEERLAGLQHEGYEVLACLEDALDDPAFRLTIVALVRRVNTGVVAPCPICGGLQGIGEHF